MTSPNLCIPFRLNCLCDVQEKGPVEDIWEEKEIRKKPTHMSKCDSLWALMTALYSEPTFLKHNFINAIPFANISLFSLLSLWKLGRHLGDGTGLHYEWNSMNGGIIYIINITILNIKGTLYKLIIMSCNDCGDREHWNYTCLVRFF